MEKEIYGNILTQQLNDDEIGFSSPEAVLKSWRQGLSIKEESDDFKGLRSPQVGALFALLSAWRIDIHESCIVLPTGTGKTETMIAAYCYEKLDKLLIVVPTKPLRHQTVLKFKTLGLIAEFEMMPDDYKSPVVFEYSESVEPSHLSELISKSNVIVTTVNMIDSKKNPAYEVFSELCSHLFVDEAHHMGARTWSKLAASFRGRDKFITYFTATPFRTDKKKIPGDIIFNYPLAKAQSDGYFKEIEYVPVFEYDRDESDEAIALKCVEIVKADLKKGYNHTAMVRVSTKKRATHLFDTYNRIAPDLNPVVIHSSSSKQTESLSKVMCGESRIVICVNMFGEGFDFPNFKIAAIHDPHKSIAVTLQFIGRFTRTSGDEIGTAKIIANAENRQGHDMLKALYEEDADWNNIIAVMSESATKEELEEHKFTQSFESEDKSKHPVNIIRPSMSTFVYDFSSNIEGIFGRLLSIGDLWKSDMDEVSKVYISRENMTAFWSVKHQQSARWGMIDKVLEVHSVLYVVYVDVNTKKMFIHSSDGGNVDKIARRIISDSNKVKDEVVFKVFSEVEVPVMLNMGSLKLGSKNTRFSMLVGSDVKKDLTHIKSKDKLMTNTFIKGYVSGKSITIGASRRKGKIWSYSKATSVLAWKKWCESLIYNFQSIKDFTSRNLLDNVIVPEVIDAIPKDHRITSADWPIELLSLSDSLQRIVVVVNGNKTYYSLLDLGISVEEMNSKKIKININTPQDELVASYVCTISENGICYRQMSEVGLSVVLRNDEIPFEDYFLNNEIQFLSQKGALLFGNNWLGFDYTKGKSLDESILIALDWTGVDIKMESRFDKQGTPRPNSIQQRRIDDFMASDDYSLIVDDDGSNEIADIVAIGKDDDREVLLVTLSHCKFSKKEDPGRRVADLYELCGQVQRSSHWKANVESMFYQLKKRIKKNRKKRLVKGDLNELNRLLKLTKRYSVEFNIEAVQPGVSKKTITPNMKELVFAAHQFLQTTTNTPFLFLCSE